MNKKILGISFLFFVFVLLSGNAFAAGKDTTLYNKTGTDALWGSLASAGIVAASYVGGSYLTKLVAGGNKLTESAEPYGTGIGTLGATLGGLIGGSAGGAIGGAAAGLFGDSLGAILFATKSSLGKLDRGLVTRVIAYLPFEDEENRISFYDTKYKVAGADTPSDKFSADLKEDKDFVRKEKDQYLQYTPVQISVKNKKLVEPIQVAVLQVPTKGLPEYIYAKEGQTSSTFAQYQPYNVSDTTSGNKDDPYAGALEIKPEGKLGEMGWCKVDDKGALQARDREVSKKYIEDLAPKEMKEGQESFVLLMKYMSALDDTINVPNYNCFGPNGLTGVTGPEFKPKVAYVWGKQGYGHTNGRIQSWENVCTKDANDLDRIYCDSTQFIQAIYGKLKLYDTEIVKVEDSITTTEEIQYNNDSLDSLYETLHFRANLMLDGYTKDFKNDFIHYIKNTTFLGYTPEEVGQFENLLSKMEFLPLSGETENPEGYRLKQAGYYNINIVIKFKVASNNNLKVVSSPETRDNVESIIVFFEEISRESNPIYYMPLDATVGVVNGVIDRVGYGVDYSSENGSAVWFSRNQGEGILLEPTLSSNSSPIVHLSMSSYEDPLSLNGNMKGTLLHIVPKTTSFGVSYDVKRYLSLPSVAKIDIKKESQGGVYAFYSVDFGYGPENAGASFIQWNLFCGYNDDGSFKGDCKSFSGARPTDDMFYPDKLGTFAKVAPTGQVQGKVYGLEWAKNEMIEGVSNVSYLGLVYLPESTKEGNMKIIIASDDETNVTSKLLPYGAVSNGVADIQAIYDLMGKGLVCMTSSQGTGLRFWWNPEPLLNPNTNLAKLVSSLIN